MIIKQQHNFKNSFSPITNDCGVLEVLNSGRGRVELLLRQIAP